MNIWNDINSNMIKNPISFDPIVIPEDVEGEIYTARVARHGCRGSQMHVVYETMYVQQTTAKGCWASKWEKGPVTFYVTHGKKNNAFYKREDALRHELMKLKRDLHKQTVRLTTMRAGIDMLEQHFNKQ